MFIDVVFLAEKLWDLFRVIAHEAWALLFPKSCDCFQYAGNTKKGAYSVKLCRNVALTFYRRKFVSSKLYACLEKFLCSVQLSDRAYVSRVFGLSTPFYTMFLLTNWGLVPPRVLVCQHDEVTKPISTVVVSCLKCTRVSTIVLSFQWGHEEPPGVDLRAAIVWLENWNERSTFALEFCGGFVAVGTF